MKFSIDMSSVKFDGVSMGADASPILGTLDDDGPSAVVGVSSTIIYDINYG